jgi:hypothetical protein
MKGKNLLAALTLILFQLMIIVPDIVSAQGPFVAGSRGPTLQQGLSDAVAPVVSSQRDRQIGEAASVLRQRSAWNSGQAPQNKKVYTILPTGVFPDDVINVQSVVNDLGLRGEDGKIILEARDLSGLPTPFNFGDGDYFAGQRGYVDVLSNSNLFGEDLGDIAFVGVENDGAQTTIIGGFLSLACWRGTKFEVTGIRFEGAEGAPIFVSRADSANIRGNDISDVHGDPFGMGTYGEPKAVGIWVAANLGALDNIRGHVEIRGNRIYDVVADSADGIAIVATNASFKISKNEIRNVNRAGIGTIWNQKPIVIEKNLIIPGPGNTPSNVGNDIGIGILTNFPIGNEGLIHVERNRIVCENPNASGIYVAGGRALFFDPQGTDMFVQNSTFSENHITMVNTIFGGIEIYAVDGPGFFGNVIAKNLIDGSGGFAIFAGGFPTGVPNALEPKVYSNLFKKNRLDAFITDDWHVILDPYTETNFYFGENETVLDLGTGNLVMLDHDSEREK